MAKFALLLVLMVLNSVIWLLMSSNSLRWWLTTQSDHRHETMLHPVFCKNNTSFDLSICDSENNLTKQAKNTFEQSALLINANYNVNLSISLVPHIRAITHLKCLRFPFTVIHKNVIKEQSTAIESRRTVHLYIPIASVVMYVSIRPLLSSHRIPLIEAVEVVRSAIPYVKSKYYEGAVGETLVQIGQMLNRLAKHRREHQQNFDHSRPTDSPMLDLSHIQQVIMCIILSVVLIAVMSPLLDRLCLYAQGHSGRDIVGEWGHATGGENAGSCKAGHCPSQAVCEWVDAISSAKYEDKFHNASCPVCLMDFETDSSADEGHARDEVDSQPTTTTTITTCRVTPITLRCGHSLCRPCLLEIATLSKGRMRGGYFRRDTTSCETAAKCPLCRAVMSGDRYPHKHDSVVSRSTLASSAAIAYRRLLRHYLDNDEEEGDARSCLLIRLFQVMCAWGFGEDIDSNDDEDEDEGGLRASTPFRVRDGDAVNSLFEISSFSAAM